MTARHEAKKEELRQDDIEKHKWRLLKIKAQLGAPDYQQDQEMAVEAQNLTNSGDWVSQSPAFMNWVSNAATRHGVLYVHGIPGAGKDFGVVLYLHSDAQSSILTFSKVRPLWYHPSLRSCSMRTGTTMTTRLP